MANQKNTSPIRLCVMNGDGISPEIMAATLEVLHAAAAKWQIEFAFDEVEVGHTDDVDKLVIAMCTFPAQADKTRVAQRLETMWQDRLRYGFWEAHALLVDDDQVELEGATRPSTYGHYVTVHVVAQKGRVPAQRLAPVTQLRVSP